MTKKLDKDLLNTWLVRGAKAILTGAVAVTGTFIFEVYNDVVDLQANEKVQNVKIEAVIKESNDTKKKIDDLHWYFIKKNNVQVPITKP